MQRMWLFLLVIFLSTSVANPIREISSERGNCHYGLTSVAAFSCVLRNNSGQTPSLTCCRALLYAIDDVPPSGESGACCLCRYLTRKYQSSKLATAYVLCKGKDRHEVANWSVLPTTCSRGAWIATEACLIVANDSSLFAFNYFSPLFKQCVWRVTSHLMIRAHPNENHTKLSLDGDGRGRSKQHSTHSSRRVKGRRMSSHSSPNSWRSQIPLSRTWIHASFPSLFPSLSSKIVLSKHQCSTSMCRGTRWSRQDWKGWQATWTNYPGGLVLTKTRPVAGGLEESIGREMAAGNKETFVCDELYL